MEFAAPRCSRHFPCGSARGRGRTSKERCCAFRLRNSCRTSSGATVWNGIVADASPRMRGIASHGALRELCETLRQHAPGQGIAPALFSSVSPQSALERALVVRMAKTLPLLAHATEWGDAAAVVSAMSALVGLGAGLTPAGDDFVVGYLAALWSRSRREPGIAALLSALAAPVGQLSLCTNAISRQMLLDALQGHFAEHLIEVMRCVAEATTSLAPPCERWKSDTVPARTSVRTAVRVFARVDGAADPGLRHRQFSR